jgi:hypothetical protein
MTLLLLSSSGRARANGVIAGLTNARSPGRRYAPRSGLPLRLAAAVKRKRSVGVPTGDKGEASAAVDESAEIVPKHKS